MITVPSTLRAARPIVWISEVAPRRKPSLSASRIATSETSGRSSPSRSRLTPTSTSYSPRRSCADDLDPLERVDLRVQVARAEAELEQVAREVLGHLLGQRRDQHALVAVDAHAHLAHQVVDLVARRADVDLRVDDPGRSHDLLDDAPRARALELAGGRRHEHDLRRDAQELLEGLRAVVERARQAEAVLDERLLARAVALVHAADLRDRLVGLVDEADEVAREVVDQAVRALAGLAAVEDPRVVLDPRAVADLAQHLHVVLRALAQAVGLEQLALGLELRGALRELLADLARRRARSSRRRRCSASPARSRRARGSRRSARRSAGRTRTASRPRRRTGPRGRRSRRRPGRPRASRPSRGSCRARAIVSLRVYWIETSLRSSASRSMCSPRRSSCMLRS